MKKVLTILVLLIFFAGISIAAPIGNNSSTGISFKDGLNNKKPMLVFIYAPWSDNSEQLIANMNSLKKVYGNSVNVVSLDIAKPETKDYNDISPIQPQLPHVMMFKDKAKISRYIPKDCALDYACISKRARVFIH